MHGKKDLVQKMLVNDKRDLNKDVEWIARSTHMGAIII